MSHTPGSCRCCKGQGFTEDRLLCTDNITRTVKTPCLACKDDTTTISTSELRRLQNIESLARQVVNNSDWLTQSMHFTRLKKALESNE